MVAFLVVLLRMYSGPFRSLTKNRRAGAGSSRMKLIRASDPSLFPVPVGDPVIGSAA